MKKIIILGAIFGLIAVLYNPVFAQIGSPIKSIPSSAPGGNSGSIQYNNSGSLGGLSNTIASQTALAGLIGQPMFYAVNYGAKFDGKTATDFTTTASSATITESGLTSADAGKAISIWSGTNVTLGAGATTTGNNLVTVTSTTGLLPGMNVQGAGIPAGDYVNGVPSATTFTLEAPATATATGLTLQVYAVQNTTLATAGSGTATLSVNATSSITGTAWATYGTDDTIALQATENAAEAAKGGVIAFPKGIGITSAPIQFGQSVGAMGQGPGVSILQYISATDQTQPVLAGKLQVAGTACTPQLALTQGANQNFYNFEIDDVSATATTQHVSAKGIAIQCNARSHVDHVYIHDTPATCLATDQAIGTTLTSNTLENCGRLNNTTAVGCNGIGDGTVPLLGSSYIFTSNTVINPAHYGIFMESETSGVANIASVVMNDNVVIQGGNTHLISGSTTSAIANSGDRSSVIVGNHIYGCNGCTAVAWDGIRQDSGTTALAQGSQSLIEANYISGVSGSGINVYNLSAVPTENVDTVVNGNIITGSALSGITLTSGATTTGYFNNIKVSNNLIFANGASGILTSSTDTMHNITIQNNQIFDNGNVSGTTDYRKSGIAINVSVVNLTVTGNMIYDSGAATQKYAFSVNTGKTVTGAYFTGNNFANNTTQPLDMLGTITGILNNNAGMPAPTISGCSATTPIGSADAGTVTSGTTGACSVVVTPYGTANIIASHGYVVSGNDLTTNSDTLTQTASTTTTFTFGGTTVTNDVLNFSAKMF